MLLLKQGRLELVAQDHVQTAFEYLQGWPLHDLPGQAVPVLSHLHGEKVFPDVQGEPPLFQSCHWAPLRRAWLRPLCTVPSGISMRW